MSTYDTKHLVERAAARLTAPWEDSATTLVDTNGVDRGQADKLRDQVTPATHLAFANDGARSRRVPYEALARAGVINIGRGRSRIAEEFRIVQSKLLREAFGVKKGAASPQHSNVILVTSARPGEGKSFVSINLAAEIARHADRRVLLIDTDLKRGSLGQLLGISNEPGLLDLAGATGGSPADLILPTAIENLEVLPFGTGSGRFTDNEIGALIQGLAQIDPARLLILDAPPCLSSSNPHLLASVVGQVVLVVAAAGTQAGEIEAAIEMMSDCPQISLLLNKIPPWIPHSFGTYGAYGYPGTQS